MPSPANANGRNPYLRANSLAELLSWHDIDFVRCAYVTMLGRQPDPEGEAYYADRIRCGRSKLEVLWQLRRSSEGPRHDPGISGLDRALKIAALRRNRLVGWIARLFYGGEGTTGADENLRQIQNLLAVIRNEQVRQSSILAAGIDPLRHVSLADLGENVAATVLAELEQEMHHGPGMTTAVLLEKVDAASLAPNARRVLSRLRHFSKIAPQLEGVG